MIQLRYHDTKPVLSTDAFPEVFISELLHLTIVEMIRGRNGLYTRRDDNKVITMYEYTDTVVESIIDTLVNTRNV